MEGRALAGIQVRSSQQPFRFLLQGGFADALGRDPGLASGGRLRQCVQSDGLGADIQL